MTASSHHLALAYQIGDSLADEPGIISQVSRYACIHIAASGLEQCAAIGLFDESGARYLSSTIGRVDLADSLQRAWLGEWAMGIMLFDEMRRGKVGSGGDEKTVKQFYGSVPGGLWINNDEICSLREMRRCSEGASMSYRVLRARHMDSELRVPRYAILSTIILPLYSHANAARYRAVANLAGSRVFLGIIAYRNRFGSYPTSLADLKKLNWQLQEDPFSGKLFVYRRQGRGFVLYNIGDDLKDNGGIEPNGSKPGDIVWTLDK